MKKFTSYKLQGAISALLLFCFLLLPFTASAQCPPTPNTINLSLSKTDVNGCNNGTITMTVNSGALGYDHLSYEITGATNISETNFQAASTTAVQGNLAPGNYTVIVRGYCLATVLTTATETITVGGSYTQPSINAEVTRKPLADCVHSGIVRFTRSGGFGTYKLTIKTAPTAAASFIKTYTFPTSPNYITLYNVPAGTYIYDFEDDCTKLQNLVLQVDVVANQKFGYKELRTNFNKDCNTLLLHISASGDLAPYVNISGGSVKDTIDKYFEITYSLDYGPDILLTNWSYNLGLIYTNVTCSSFSDWRGKNLSFTQKFNPAVLSGGCPNTVFNDSHSSNPVSNKIWGNSFSPELFTENNPCNEGIYMPKNGFNNNPDMYLLFCFPVTYQVLDAITNNPATDKSGNLLDNVSLANVNSQNKHYLNDGSYILQVISDGSNTTSANWQPLPFTIGGTPPAINTTMTLNDRYTANFYFGNWSSTVYDPVGDQDKYYPVVSPELTRTGGFPAGTRIKFIDVPPIPSELVGFNGIVEKNDEYFLQTDDNGYFGIKINRYEKTSGFNGGNLNYMPPGNYIAEIEITCRPAVQIHFTVPEPALSGWDYTISRDCANQYILTFKSGMTSNVTVSGNNFLNSVNYYGNTFGAVPLNGTSPLVFNGPGTYKIHILSGSSSFFVREVVIPDFQFTFDPTKTHAFVCPGSGAVVGGMIINGTPTSTFVYELEVETSPGSNSWTTVPGSTQTLSLGQLYTYTYASGTAGMNIRIKATQNCAGGGSITIFEPATINTFGSTVNITAPPMPACTGTNVKLLAPVLPGANYQWYKTSVTNPNMIPGANTYDYTITNLQSPDADTYFCTVNVPGCAISAVGQITVSVDPCFPAYEIWNWEDLNYLRSMLDAYPQTEWDSYGRKAKLMQNLGTPQGVNACGAPNFGSNGPGTNDKKYGWYGYEDPACGWDPIEGWNPIDGFGGSEFDGQGFEISGVWMDKGMYEDINGDAGLFRNVSSSVIKNLGINTSEKGIIGWAAGGLALYAHTSLIENCFVNGYVSATFSCVGGLLGYAWGSSDYDWINEVVLYSEKTIVRNCYTTGKVTGNNGAGLVFQLSNADIVNCYSTCDVSTFGLSGGLVALMQSSYWDNSSISNCYASGTICGDIDVGGILAQFNPEAAGAISNCFVFCPAITCKGENVGRILGADWHVLTSGYGHPITLTYNYALETILVNSDVVTTGTATNNDGQNINFSAATNSTTYSAAWGSDYTNWTTPNAGYNTGAGVNLPILKAFNNTNFSCAMQIPRIKLAPTKPTAINAPETNICVNADLTLTAQGGSDGEGAIFEWSYGNTCGENVISGQTGATITVNPSANTKYWVCRVATNLLCPYKTPCAWVEISIFKPVVTPKNTCE